MNTPSEEESISTAITPVSTRKSTLPVSADKINSLVQKEETMYRVGVTREKYLRVIAESLEAMKVGDIVHDNGNVTRGLIPDVARRQWAVEQSAKLFGDMVEHKKIEGLPESKLIIIRATTEDRNAFYKTDRVIDTIQAETLAG